MLLWVWVCSEGRRSIKQFELWGLGWGARAAKGKDEQDHSSVNASSSSLSTGSHHYLGQPMASGKENEVILTPLLLFFVVLVRFFFLVDTVFAEDVQLTRLLRP